MLKHEKHLIKLFKQCQKEKGPAQGGAAIDRGIVGKICQDDRLTAGEARNPMEITGLCGVSLDYPAERDDKMPSNM